MAVRRLHRRVLLLLFVDLFVLHKDAHEVRFREALGWSAAWVSLALLFNAGLYAYALWAFPQDPRLAAIPGFDAEAAAWQIALEFLTGYVVEYSLSVDNIFVFVLVLGYFGVPARYQHRVLFYGILGALVFRGIFISLGALLMQFHWVVWLFGAFLIVTGLRMLRAHRGGRGSRAQPADPARAPRGAGHARDARPALPRPPGRPAAGPRRSWWPCCAWRGATSCSRSTRCRRSSP